MVLFVYVSTLYAETVKLLDFLVQLARWSTDNASDYSPRVPGFDSRLLQGYLCLVVLLCCEIFIILVQTPLFVMKCCNYFCDGNLFKYYTKQPTTFVTDYKDIKHLEYFVSPKRALLLLHCHLPG